MRSDGSVVAVFASGVIAIYPRVGAAPKIVTSIEVPDISVAAIAPSGSRVAFGAPGTVGWVDVATLEKVISKDLPGRVSSIVFNHDESGVLAGGVDGDIYHIRPNHADKRRRVERYSGISSVPSSLALLEDAPVFFSGDWGGNLTAWELYEDDATLMFFKDYSRDRTFLQQSTRISKPRSKPNPIDAIAVRPQGDALVLAVARTGLELWRSRGLSQIDALPLKSGDVLSMVFSSDGSRLAVRTKTKLVIVALEASLDRDTGQDTLTWRLVQELEQVQPERLVAVTAKEVTGISPEGALVQVRY